MPDPEDSCSLADNIKDLVRLEHELDREDIYVRAVTTSWGGVCSWNFTAELGEEAFRRGFGKLYLKKRDDLTVSGEENLDACFGIDMGLCYLKEAFVTSAPPEQASIADAIISADTTARPLEANDGERAGARRATWTGGL